MRHAARTYMTTQVTTTSQGQLLIMLYDGAIKFLVQAKERMAVRDYAGKGKLISSAIDVINELGSSLNAEKGGELAANLNQLYFYCNKRLFIANSRMDIAPIDEVITILDGIRSAYAQIIDTPEAVAAMAKAPAPVGNPMRAPVNAQAAPTGGAPIPKAKAHNAYGAQGARLAKDEENAEAAALPLAPEAQRITPEAAPQPPSPAREDVLPVAVAAPDPTPTLAPLDFDEAQPASQPVPSFSVGKRMATAALYKKFAS